MRKILGLFIASTVAFTPLPALAETIKPKAQSKETIELGTRYTLHSNILGEDREILVRLPEGYAEGDTQYPVVYITDAESHFSYATLMAGVLEEQGRMPASIFVGVTNAEGTRTRDLLLEKDNFLRYLKEEVFSFVNRKFRTTGLRTFYGGSLGGNFALNTLANQKDMFTNYIAASPAADDYRVKQFEGLFAANTTFDKSVYFTMTEKGEEGAPLFNGVNALNALFKEKAPKDLKWRYEFIGREVHMTTPIPTIYAGLSHVFRDFQAPTFSSSAEYERAGGMKGLQAYFAARASKYGASTEVPVDLRISIGEAYTEEGKHKKANAIFSETVKLFPEHRIAFSRLGGSYMDLEMHEDALNAYKRALSLTDPQNLRGIDYYEARITAMEAKLTE